MPPVVAGSPPATRPSASSGPSQPSARRERRPVRFAVSAPLILREVAFSEYAALREKPGNAHLKMTFDGPAGGLLEIETPQGLLHESISRLFTLLIAAFCEERKLPMRLAGSVTQRSERADRGCESDECYYLASAAAMAGKDSLDLDAGDPPPDLAVEVDVTSPGVSKLPIYHALGVPEVWVWADEEITVYRRGATAMQRADDRRSAVLPDFPIDAATAFLGRRAVADQPALVAQWRERLRTEP
ncbi:MAG: Uma2 family endonuclease [Planctomycetota bacterium]